MLPLAIGLSAVFVTPRIWRFLGRHQYEDDLLTETFDAALWCSLAWTVVLIAEGILGV